MNTPPHNMQTEPVILCHNKLKNTFLSFTIFCQWPAHHSLELKWYSFVRITASCCHIHGQQEAHCKFTQYRPLCGQSVSENIICWYWWHLIYCTYVVSCEYHVFLNLHICFKVPKLSIWLTNITKTRFTSHVNLTGSIWAAWQCVVPHLWR